MNGFFFLMIFAVLPIAIGMILKAQYKAEQAIIEKYLTPRVDIKRIK